MCRIARGRIGSILYLAPGDEVLFIIPIVELFNFQWLKMLEDLLFLRQNKCGDSAEKGLDCHM